MKVHCHWKTLVSFVVSFKSHLSTPSSRVIFNPYGLNRGLLPWRRVQLMGVLAPIILFLSTDAWSKPSFANGLEFYKKQEWKKAKDTWSQLLKKHPKNPILLYNLGLVHYKLGEKGWALALWRDAKKKGGPVGLLNSAIQYGEEKLPSGFKNSSPFFGDIYIWATEGFWPHVWWAFWLLSSCFFLWKLGTVWGERKKPVFTLPYGVYIAFCFSLIFCFFSLICLWESLREEATVVQDEVWTHTNPSSTSPTLFELYQERGWRFEVNRGDGSR